MAAELRSIVEFLDRELKTDVIPDYGGALNGLQLENSGRVTKIGSAVDATGPVIDKAIAAGVDLLIVHHGLFWQGAERITGSLFKKISSAIANNLAIYSSHIPLDVHNQFGNNALLASEIAEANWEPFFDYKGIKLGLKADVKGTASEVATKVEEATGFPLLRPLNDGDRSAGCVGVITGGAGSEIGRMSALGINTFVTGEAPHWAAGIAEESQVELVLGGHYATETFGVRAIAKHTADHHSCESEHISHPSFL